MATTRMSFRLRVLLPIQSASCRDATHVGNPPVDGQDKSFESGVEKRTDHGWGNLSSAMAAYLYENKYVTRILPFVPLLSTVRKAPQPFFLSSSNEHHYHVDIRHSRIFVYLAFVSASQTESEAKSLYCVLTSLEVSARQGSVMSMQWYHSAMAMRSPSSFAISCGCDLPAV